MPTEPLTFDHYKLLTGDAFKMLKTLPDNSVQNITTSPPYFALRAYGTEHQIFGGDPDCDHTWSEEIPGSSRGGSGPGSKEKRSEDTKSSYGRAAARGNFCTSCGSWRGELGLEPTPDLFVRHMVQVFREVKRVLREDGTVFLNIADTYNNCSPVRKKSKESFEKTWDGGQAKKKGGDRRYPKTNDPWKLKQKDLCGVPHRLVQALQEDGWWWRSDAVWSKAGGNCPKCHYRLEKGSSLPEPVIDRFSKSHEYVFLLAKNKKYYFDVENVKEPHTTARRRDVFYIPSQSYRGAHHATMPESLAELCVRGGTSDHGACSKCRAPYKRETKKGKTDLKAQKKAGGDNAGAYTGQNTKDYEAHNAQKPSDVKRRILAGMKKIETTGWAQTCKCVDPGDPVPCVVLDPFSGSGTTGAAALKLGRRYVGIDLLEANNVNLAEPRLQEVLATRKPPEEIDFLPTTDGIYHGRAEDLLQRVKPASVRLILTDPPYNVSRKNNLHTMKGREGINFDWDGDFDQEAWIHIADKALMPGGSIVIWNDWKNLGIIAHLLEDMGYSVKRNLIWKKLNPFPRNRDRSFVQSMETALWAVKPKGKWVFNRKESKTFENGIFSYGVPRGKTGRQRHAAKKPDEMFEEIIKILSNPKDLILDPFAGGGTTAYAATRTDRRHISFELDSQWYKEALAHWLDAAPSSLHALAFSGK